MRSLLRAGRPSSRSPGPWLSGRTVGRVHATAGTLVSGADGGHTPRPGPWSLGWTAGTCCSRDPGQWGGRQAHATAGTLVSGFGAASDLSGSGVGAAALAAAAGALGGLPQ